MNKFVRIVKHELQEAIVPTIFFFMAFHIVAVTKTLMLDSYQMTATSMIFATVLALIVAKAVLISNKLPFVSLFSSKPLIISVLWKTAIYGILVFVFRCIEELIPLLSKYDGLAAATEHVISDVSWPHFWALQIWLFVALILYNSAVELDGHFGVGSLRKAFLGHGQSTGGSGSTD